MARGARTAAAPRAVASPGDAEVRKLREQLRRSRARSRALRREVAAGNMLLDSLERDLDEQDRQIRDAELMTAEAVSTAHAYQAVLGAWCELRPHDLDSSEWESFRAAVSAAHRAHRERLGVPVVRSVGDVTPANADVTQTG